MYNIKHLLKLYFFNRKWRKSNQHNMTRAGTLFPVSQVEVGKGTYGEINAKFYGNPMEKLVIGNYVSIADDVYFCMGGEHQIQHMSNYPFSELFFKEDKPITKGPIIIEDDVWIGCRTTILSGIRIGKGAVIAAGSVIHKDVPPYAVVSSERIIRYRFSQSVCDELRLLDFSKLSYKNIYELKNTLTEKVVEDNVKTLVENFERIV